MIFVTGHKGFLGSQLINLGCQAFDLSHVKAHDVVINCLAKTDHNECETDPLRAYASNVEFLQTLLWDARDIGFKVIHISSDYVFDGTKAQEYVEDDPICPVNSVYARSKAAAEICFSSLAPHGSTMIRTSWLFGPGRKAWFDFSSIWKQVGTPTYTKDLAIMLIKVAESMTIESVPRIMHYSTADSMFRSQVAQLAGNTNFQIVDVPHGKPKNSALKTSDWILKRHLRPQLWECINDFRTATTSPLRVVSRQPRDIQTDSR